MRRHLVNPLRGRPFARSSFRQKQYRNLASRQFPDHDLQRAHALSQPFDEAPLGKLYRSQSVSSLFTFLEIFRHIGSTSYPREYQ